MVVLINKMDDPTVEWAEERYAILFLLFFSQGVPFLCLFRYNECRDKLLPVLKKAGFKPGKDLYFMPCSGMTGAFLKDPAPENVCPWYR